jgi:predicted lysophospholipase L1 biosynthesis ABC-type transport system permease subunit
MTASLRGEEACISSLRTSLTDVLDGMRPWYSWIAMVDLFLVWFPILTVPYLLLQALGLSRSSSSKVEIPFRTAVYMLAVVVGALAAIAFVIWGTSRLRSRFFPVSTFAIGQGLGRHQLDEQIRWVVIVGFLVSVAASIFLAPMLAA